MDKYTVRDASGNVDVNASAEAYGLALTKWQAENETDPESISNAVNAVLDRFPDQRIPMPALLGLSVAELKALPSQHGSLSKRVQAYVKGQVASNKLFVTKGAGGGISNAPPVAKPTQ